MTSSESNKNTGSAGAMPQSPPAIDAGIERVLSVQSDAALTHQSDAPSNPLPKQFPTSQAGEPGIFTSLSGKFVLLTIIFIMIAEVLIFVPSVANFKRVRLMETLKTVEASTIIFGDDFTTELSTEGRMQLLKAVGANAIILERGGARRLIAETQMPVKVDSFIDLSKFSVWSSIVGAFDTMINGDDRVVRVRDKMQSSDGHIEILYNEAQLRSQLLTHGRNVFLISLLIAAIVAALVFLALRWLLIRPLQNMKSNMMAFSRDPENASLVIEPSGRRDEIGVSEEQLAGMQMTLQQTLQHQKRLADLGLAVSKINHDLRNVLASALLISDRLTALPDPTVQKFAPKLIRTIERAVSYTKSVLEYGKAVEAPPERRLVRLRTVTEELAETLALENNTVVEWVNTVDPDFEIDADSEQLFRVLTNLCRNSIQAMTENSGPANVNRLKIEAWRDPQTAHIIVSDTGPGIAEHMRENMFKAFHGSTNAGGTGLGLSIAAEIVRAHGGKIGLAERPIGAAFEIEIPYRGADIHVLGARS